MRHLAAAAFALALGTAPAAAFTEAERAEIVAVVRRALREDPSILRDAMAAGAAAEQAEREGAVRAALVDQADALFRDPGDPVRGNPVGAVTLVEFFDARCPYCKSLQPVLDQLLRRQRDVRLVVKDLPILGPPSVLASRALLAAQRQGRYHELREAVLRLREEPTEPVLRREAERVGLDWPRLRREMEDPAVGRRLEANLRLASALRIDGTPAMVIGTTLVPGVVELGALERLVAEARAGR